MKYSEDMVFTSKRLAQAQLPLGCLMRQQGRDKEKRKRRLSKWSIHKHADARHGIQIQPRFQRVPNAFVLGNYDEINYWETSKPSASIPTRACDCPSHQAHGGAKASLVIIFNKIITGRIVKVGTADHNSLVHSKCVLTER